MIYGKIFHVLKRGFWILYFEAYCFVLLSGFYDFFTSSFTWLRSLCLIKTSVAKKILQRICKFQKSSICKNVPRAWMQGVLTYLYNICAACSRFSFTHVTRAHAISWCLSHAVAIFFPRRFFDRARPGRWAWANAAGSGRVCNWHQATRSQTIIVYSGVEGVSWAGMDDGAQHRYSWMLSEGLDCFCMQRMAVFSGWRLFGGQWFEMRKSKFCFFGKATVKLRINASDV